MPTDQVHDHDQFICHLCGAETDTAPQLPTRSVCPACCPDHDYRYEPSYGFHVCTHCNQPRPLDWSTD